MLAVIGVLNALAFGSAFIADRIILLGTRLVLRFNEPTEEQNDGT